MYYHPNQGTSTIVLIQGSWLTFDININTRFLYIQCVEINVNNIDLTNNQITSGNALMTFNRYSTPDLSGFITI